MSDANGACVYVNDRWCQLAGITQDRALGEGWAAALHPADAERVGCEWAEAAAEGRDSIVEYRFLRQDGSIAWIQGFASALRDEHGDIIGWVGTCLDLTAQREAGEQVHRASQRFQTAFDNAPIGMALLARDGRWLQVNPALCLLLGYAEDELLRLTYLDVTHPDDRPASLERKQRQLDGADEKAIEKRYVRSDGTVVWVSVTSTLVRDATGEPLYSVSQIEDVGDRKRAADELRHLAEHDPLTGVLNRRRFHEEVGRELTRLQRQGGSSALLLIDLDHFKHVNDSLGHKAGDDLLIAVGKLLLSRARRTDAVGRLGGDEFAVMATGTDADGARVLADAIASGLRRHCFVTSGTSVQVTSSVGVVMLDDHALSADEMISAADTAMYRAKREGRNRVSLVA